METVSVRLPNALKKRLAAAARKEKKSRSEIVRSALETYLDSDWKPMKGSMLDLARDVIGSCSGPGDLSTNPKYMEDYGR